MNAKGMAARLTPGPADTAVAARVSGVIVVSLAALVTGGDPGELVAGRLVTNLIGAALGLVAAVAGALVVAAWRRRGSSADLAP